MLLYGKFILALSVLNALLWLAVAFDQGTYIAWGGFVGWACAAIGQLNIVVLRSYISLLEDDSGTAPKG